MPTRKILWSTIAIVSTLLAYGTFVDDTSRQQADAALKNALVTFAVSRTLNGVISVAQGTELALEPGGVGVILTLGQVLDPINDLVERFSSIMLVATSSIGLQSLMLRISSWWGFTLLLTVIAGFALASLWRRDARHAPLAIRLLLIAIFLRFAVPALVITSTLVFDQFLADEQRAATEALDATRVEIEEINEEAGSPPGEKSFLEQLNSALDSVNLDKRLDELSERVSSTVEQIIGLIVIFVLQTILLPLGFLWLVIRLLKVAGERVTRF